MPMMRPLFFEAPNDSLALICNDTYLWGSNFLVSPVLEKGANQKYVVLPPNSAWYDFYTGAFYENSENTSKSILVDVLLERIPLFVRAGSIIPLHPPINNLSEFDQNSITYHFYLDPKIKTGSAIFMNDNNLPKSNANYNINEMVIQYELKRKKMKIRSTLDKTPYNIQISVNGTSSIRRIWLNKKKKI
jgi:alpha-glucosidase (family GH31 glycosyl hydrolase)